MSASSWIENIRHKNRISARRKFWDGVLPSTRLVYVDYEIGAIGIHLETFQLKDGLSFEDIRLILPSIKNALGAENVCVCPVGEVMDSGDENLGTISLSGFRLVWTENNTLPSIFDKELTRHERDFIVRLEVIPMLSEDPNIGYCPLLHARLVTDESSSDDVVIVSLISLSGAKLSDFASASENIADSCHARLVGFSNEGEFDSSMMVSIIISARNKAAVDGDVSFIGTNTIPIAKGIKSARELVNKG